VHSVITGRDGTEGEFKVRGTARAEHGPSVQRRYAEGVAADLGWNPQPGREFIRRATSPTSVGNPEPASGVLQASWPAPGPQFC
jgi:hypothetical protein